MLRPRACISYRAFRGVRCPLSAAAESDRVEVTFRGGGRNAYRPIIIRLLAEALIARHGTFKRHSDRNVKRIRNERNVRLETREIIGRRNQSAMPSPSGLGGEYFSGDEAQRSIAIGSRRVPH